MKDKLTWYQEYDDNDNSIWEACSCWVEEEGGPSFKFRLKQRLVNNAIEWYEASDAEVMKDEDYSRVWPSLYAAQLDIQADHEAMLDEAERSKE